MDRLNSNEVDKTVFLDQTILIEKLIEWLESATEYEYQVGDKQVIQRIIAEYMNTACESPIL